MIRMRILRSLAERLVIGDDAPARAFDNLIIFLIILCVASIALETVGGLPAWVTSALRVTEIITLGVFSLEYLLRVIAARNRLSYIFSFSGIVDLLAIAPVFFWGADTRWLRVLRLVRLVRVLKLQTRLLEAKVAERTSELADRNAALEAAQAQIQAELGAARALQIAILPARFPVIPGCAGAGRMLPATTMGGDFYDYIELRDGRIGLVVGDVSGKGVPAAFFMAVARTNLREIAIHSSGPGECLTRTNQVLLEQNPMDLFVTLFYGVFDPSSGLLTYANAGHNPPCLRRADGAVELLAGAPGLVLGAMPGITYRDHLVQVRSGDRLVLYTDGVTEAFNPAGEEYGMERLLVDVGAHGGAAAAALVERIFEQVRIFAGEAPQSDDITLTVLSWTQD
jgi:serine phosphatase RsbU (regulator of sigma subunit)